MPFSSIENYRAVRSGNRAIVSTHSYSNNLIRSYPGLQFQRNIETRTTMVVTMANCGGRFMFCGLFGTIFRPRRAYPAHGRFDFYVAIRSPAQYNGARIASTREKEGRHDHQGHYRFNTSHH